MTKYLLNAGILALFAAGCTSTVKDTGDTSMDTDTDTDTDTDVTPAFAITGSGAGQGVTGDCADGWCVYTITTTAPAGDMELDLTETADSFLYNEAHTAFELESTNDDGTETYRLELAWVTDLAEVVVNETTLFNPSTGESAPGAEDGTVLDGTTWYWGAYSADGSEFDCRVTGDNPDYYSDWCTTVVR